MVLTVHSAAINRAVGLTRDAEAAFEPAPVDTGEFAAQQTTQRWTYNTEASRFANAYRDRLSDMKKKMEDIAALVHQFEQGIADSEAEIEGVDEAVASYMQMVGGEIEGAAHEARTAVAE